MTNRKNTKRALFASVISMLLCVTMLVGSTFAWFTDNATTSVNTIEAGTLNIGLYTDENCTTSAEGQTLSFTKGGENVLWEPGATWTLPTVYIKNEGNLAVKYKVEITGIDGDALLNEAIDWTITYAANATEGKLGVGEKTSVSISGTMKTTAGNEYQGLSIDGIAITVKATQDTVEYDSTSNQYDANATYDEVVNVSNQDELNAALAANTADKPVTLVLSAGNYTLPNDMKNKNVTFTGAKSANLTVSNNTDAANSTIAFEGITVLGDMQGSNWYTVQLNNTSGIVYKDCTIKGLITAYSGSAFVSCTFENTFSNQYSVYCYADGTYYFTDCIFNTACSKALKIYDEGGTNQKIVNIENCTFNNTGASNKAAVEIDSTYRTTTKYEVNIFDCKLTGNYTKLWADDATNATVTVDGVVEQE